MVEVLNAASFPRLVREKNNSRKNHYFEGERKLKASVFNNTYQWTFTLGSRTVTLPFHLSCT